MFEKTRQCLDEYEAVLTGENQSCTGRKVIEMFPLKFAQALIEEGGADNEGFVFVKVAKIILEYYNK